MKKLATSAWCALVFLIVPFALTAQLPSYLPTNGLVAWYPFNGNANDESGNGNNGVVNGAVLTSDRFGLNEKAYNFNGSSISIENAGIAAFGLSSFTVAAWFKTNEETAGDLIRYDNCASGACWGLRLGYDSPGFVQGLEASVSRNANFVTSNSTYNDNSWHNVIYIRDVSSMKNKIYIDGSFITESDFININNIDSTGNPLLIGVCGGWYDFYKGDIDDICFWNRSLNDNEISSLFNATSTGSNEGNTNTAMNPGIPYQAEVRNENGEVLANTNENIRFTLHELTANGTASYQETHALTTNELGLFAATIGAGTAVQGTFASINWAQTTKFLQVEVDTGNGWITMGNQQLMSVPYAMYAANGPQGPAGADGQPGPQGEPGENGLSAYELWLAEGYSGSISDFLNSQTNNWSTAHGSFQATGLGVFVVPNNVKNIELNMSGSIGGNGGTAIGLGFTQYSGGAGGISGFIRVIIPVNPGDSIMFQIGNNGINGDNCLATGSCGSFPGCACVGGSGTPGEISTLKLNGMNLFHISGGTGGTGGSYGLPNAFGNSGSQGIVTFSSQSISSGIIPLATNVWNIEQRSILIRY